MMRCGKLGCERKAAKTLRFTDMFQRVTPDESVHLCDQHSLEVQKFDPSDVAGVQAWLKSVE